MSKPVSIKTERDFRTWKEVLSVYVELYRERVFRKGSNVYDRMMKISTAIQKCNPFRV